MKKKIACSLLALTLAFNAAPTTYNYNMVVQAQDSEDVATINDSTYTITGVGVNAPTQSQIAGFYKNRNIASAVNYSTDYATEPDFVNHTSGAISATAATHAINTLNYVRYIAGLSYNVTNNDDYAKLAQDGSYLNDYNGSMSHYPGATGTAANTYFASNNSNVTETEKATYASGVQGAAESNIAYSMAWTSATQYQDAPTLYYNIINGWMEDGDSDNIAKVGHRRWCLNPTMSQTGFGSIVKQYIDENNKYYTTTSHSAMYVVDKSDTSQSNIKGVAWPAYNTPLDVFGQEFPWSYSPDKTISGTVTVALTRLNDNQTWNFNSASSGSMDSSNYISINNDPMGQAGCVIFDPNISYSHDDVFWVEIKENGSTMASYPVSFFDISKVTATSSIESPSAMSSTFTYGSGSTDGSGDTATTYSISTNLTNITISNSSSVDKNETFSATLTAKTGYNLPSSISVTMGGSTLATSKYTYNSSTGAISVPDVTGNIVITASGETLPNAPTPTISGKAEVGETLTASISSKDLSDFSVQWYADGVKISGATSSTLNLVHDYLGKTITVGVTAPANSEEYNSSESISLATDAVQAFYTITFESEDGTETITTNGDATLGSFPDTPADYKDNDDVSYTFAGWYDGSDKITSLTVFVGDATVNAKYAEVKEVKSDVVSTDGTLSLNITAGDSTVAFDVSDVSIPNLDDGVTNVSLKISDSLENFILVGIDKLVDNLEDSQTLTITLGASNSASTNVVTWTIASGTEIESTVNFAVTIHDAGETTDSSTYNGGAITFSHSGDLVSNGTGLTIEFPTEETVNSNHKITLSKFGDSDIVTGSYVSSDRIKATFTNCSTWGISLIANATSGSSGGASSDSSDSGNTYWNYTTNDYETGSISTIPSLGYISQFRNVILGELINLDRINVNGMEIIGWYYDTALTNQVENTSMFVVTQSVLDNGLYPKFATTVSDTLIDGSVNAGYVDTSVDTDTNYIPTAVPSTIGKVLAKLF